MLAQSIMYTAAGSMCLPDSECCTEGGLPAPQPSVSAERSCCCFSLMVRHPAVQLQKPELTAARQVILRYMHEALLCRQNGAWTSAVSWLPTACLCECLPLGRGGPRASKQNNSTGTRAENRNMRGGSVNQSCFWSVLGPQQLEIRAELTRVSECILCGVST